MKRILLVLVVLLVAFGLSAQLRVTGDTGATAYHDDGTVGVIDTDQNITLSYGPLSLAGNLGYAYTFSAANPSAISFGYTVTVAQAFGPLALTATAASNALTQTIGGAFSGDFLGDMTAKAVIAKDIVSGTAYALFTAKKGYPIFMGVDVSGTVAPKWGSFTLGGSFLDAQAVTDGVGYVNAVAAVEGLSFYAKAKVSY
jgi:hypothetical protein